MTKTKWKCSALNMRGEVEMKQYYKTMLLSSAAVALETFVATSLVSILLDKLNWLTIVSASVVAGLIQMVAYIGGSKPDDVEQNEWRKKDFHVGDVVQTVHGLDRGLVKSVDKNNMPKEVLASPGINMKTGEYTEVSYYGGDHSVGWYKTGEHMTPQAWHKLYSMEEGWQRYCEDRSNQIKLDE